MIALDRITQLIERAAEAGFELVRACDLPKNEQSPAANWARSESESRLTDGFNSSVYETKFKPK